MTLVAASVTGTVVAPDRPYAAHGPWLQVLIPDDFVDEIADSLEPLQNPDQVVQHLISRAHIQLAFKCVQMTRICYLPMMFENIYN